MLQEKENRRADNPLKYCVQHPKQIEATNSDKSIRVLFWGNRVGKTEWGAQEMVRYLKGEHPVKLIVPPVEAWCACPSFELQVETTQKKLEYYLSPKDIDGPIRKIGDVWKSLTIKGGSKLNFKSYEQGREKFQGVGKRIIWFDEEPPSDIWEECIVRQEAGVPLDIIMSMTPVNGMTWVYDDLFLDTGNPDLFISQANWDDNPWLTEDQKNKMIGGLKTEEAKKVRREGLFVARVGLICSWWRREKHVREYTELPKDWAYFETFDGGWSDPATWLLIGIDLTGNLHVVDGFMESGLLTDEIKSRRDDRISGLMMRGGICDNDNPRLNEELSILGMKLRPIEKKPHESGSWDETMAEAMAKYGAIQKGTGEPMLFVNKNLPWLIQQIENLKWLEIKKKEGHEIKPTWNDHRRFKHHFDAMYALAYFCVEHDIDHDALNIKTLPQFINKRKWSI